MHWIWLLLMSLVEATEPQAGTPTVPSDNHPGTERNEAVIRFGHESTQPGIRAMQFAALPLFIDGNGVPHHPHPAQTTQAYKIQRPKYDKAHPHNHGRKKYKYKKQDTHHDDKDHATNGKGHHSPEENAALRLLFPVPYSALKHSPLSTTLSVPSTTTVSVPLMQTRVPEAILTPTTTVISGSTSSTPTKISSQDQLETHDYMQYIENELLYSSSEDEYEALICHLEEKYVHATPLAYPDPPGPHPTQMIMATKETESVSTSMTSKQASSSSTTSDRYHVEFDYSRNCRIEGSRTPATHATVATGSIYLISISRCKSLEETATFTTSSYTTATPGYEFTPIPVIRDNSDQSVRVTTTLPPSNVYVFAKESIVVLKNSDQIMVWLSFSHLKLQRTNVILRPRVTEQKIQL